MMLKHLPLPMLLISAALILVACQTKEDAANKQIKAVKTAVVRVSSNEVIRELAGVVKTANESNLSFRVGGRVKNVEVERGESVQQGQILAELDPEDYIIQVNSAQAKLNSARSELATAAQENKRYKELLQQQFISRAEADRAETAYQEAVGKVTVATTDLENANFNLERTLLRAPFDGQIVSKAIDPFVEVKAGEAVFVIQSTEGLEVEILVPETLIREIDNGDKAAVSFPTIADLSVKAVISQVGVRSETGNAYPVTLKLLSRNLDIRPGMTAEVALVIDKHHDETKLLIPTSALDLRFYDAVEGSAAHKSHVFIVNPETFRLQAVPVVVEDIKGNQLEISGALKAGDRLVVAGVSFLNEGQEVKLWQPNYSVPATLNR